jgi:hypothetical protein
LKSVTGQYGAEGVVLSHNLVLTQVEPAKTMTIAAILLPFPLGKNAPASEPQVRVEQGRESVVFTVTGSWGTDRVQCDLSEGGAARSGRSLIQVTRNRGQGEETVFVTGDGLA